VKSRRHLNPHRREPRTERRETLQRATEDEGVEDGYYAPDDDTAESLMAGELIAGDELHTTPKHMAVCGAASVLAMALLAEGSQDATQYSTLLAGAKVISSSP
jgi:hypothetical protein